MYKKSISILLTFCMVFSLMSFNVFATGDSVVPNEDITPLSDSTSGNSDGTSSNSDGTENNTNNDVENNSENNSDDNTEDNSEPNIIKDARLKFTFRKTDTVSSKTPYYAPPTAATNISAIVDGVAYIIKNDDNSYVARIFYATKKGDINYCSAISPATDVSVTNKVYSYTKTENHPQNKAYDFKQDSTINCFNYTDIPINFTEASNTIENFYVCITSYEKSTTGYDNGKEPVDVLYEVALAGTDYIRDHVDESTVKLPTVELLNESYKTVDGQYALMRVGSGKYLPYQFKVDVKEYVRAWWSASRPTVLEVSWNNYTYHYNAYDIATGKLIQVYYTDETEKIEAESPVLKIGLANALKEQTITIKLKQIVGIDDEGKEIWNEGETYTYIFTPTKPATIQVVENGVSLYIDGDQHKSYPFYTDAVPTVTQITDTAQCETAMQAVKNCNSNLFAIDYQVFDFTHLDAETGKVADSAIGTWDFSNEYFTETSTLQIGFMREHFRDGWNLDCVTGYKILSDGTAYKLEKISIGAEEAGQISFNITDTEGPSARYVFIREKYENLDKTGYTSIVIPYNAALSFGAYIPFKDGRFYELATEILAQDFSASTTAKYFDSISFSAKGTKGLVSEDYAGLTATDSNFYLVGGNGTVGKASVEEMIAAGYENAETAKYITLIPDENDVYVKSVKIGEQDATILEEYTVGENKYPKVIKIDGENAKQAYVEAVITLSDDTSQTIQIGTNFLGAKAINAYTAVVPEITTSTGKFKYVNRYEEPVSVALSTASVDAKIMYSINDGEEREYTEAISISSPDTDDATSYVIKAYTVKDGIANSAIAEKTIVFREAGAYAEDAATPVIKARYAMGDTATDGKYNVEITSSTEAAKIYYTTDGTEPTKESTEYTEKFLVDALTNGNATIIKAIAYADNHNDSELAETTIEFSTDWFDSLIDGDVIEISARMYMWPLKNPATFSMGNQALTGKATLRKIDGKVYADVDFQAINMGIGAGYLIDYWYFENQDDALNGTTADAALDRIGVDPQGYTAASFIVNFGKKCQYFYENDNADNPIDYIRMPLFRNEENVVCGLESSATLMGKQMCVMNLDFDNAIEFVTGQEVEKELIVDTPVIAPVLSADGDSYEISLYIPDTSDTKDADIYYMISGDDEADLSGIISEANKYTNKFTVSKDDADEFGGAEGTFNVYAVGVKSGYTNSVINTMKLTFDDASSDDSGDDGEGGGSGSGSTGGSTGDEADEVDVTKDGKYWVEIALYKASENSESMGDVAFDKNRKALITTKNGTSTIQIASNPVSIPPYYSALKEMQFENKSGKWQYVTDITRKTITANDGEDKHSLSYLALFEFELPSTSDKYVPVKINVPYTPMDGISANVGGFIEARIMIDWSSLSKASSSATLKPSTGSSTGNSSYASGGSSSTKDEDEETTPSALVHDVTDKDTGIRITAEKDVYDAKATFEVTAVTEGADYESVAELLADTADNGYDVYEVSATLNKKEAEQTGFATLYIPVGDEDVNKTVIYSYAEETETTNAGLTALEIELSEDGKYYVVKVSEMGTFVVAQADEAVNSFTNDTASSAAAKFEDIENHWGKEYIEKAVEKGMFSGVSENRFAPDDTATRAMLVTVLSRLEGVDTAAFADKENIFDDIKSDDWFYAHVLWAAENGIVKGVAENLFDPNSDITREQMATILYRYIVSKGITLADGEAALFTDEAEISEYAKEAVAALAKAKIITGKDGGKFDPKGTATRAELATMLIRFVNEYMTESAE